MLTCDATVRFNATPPAFKLITNILHSGSSVNFLIAASLAAIDIDPTSWTQQTPDCKKKKKMLQFFDTKWEKKQKKKNKKTKPTKMAHKHLPSGENSVSGLKMMWIG